jgi:hypothetical protein
MSRIITTKKGFEIIVDDEDYNFLNEFTWCYTGEAALTKILNKTTYLHRMLMNPPTGFQVDHIDRNPLNNQKSNLRICTLHQNRLNRGRQKDNSSGYKGVYWKPKVKKWQAGIGFNKKYIYLGLFNTPKDAAEAYNAAAIKYHGEFAALNPI